MQTEENLIRIKDILVALEERVEPLRVQSEKAKKYLELREAKMAVDIALALFDVDTAKTQTEELSAKLILAKLDKSDAPVEKAVCHSLHSRRLTRSRITCQKHVCRRKPGKESLGIVYYDILLLILFPVL